MTELTTESSLLLNEETPPMAFAQLQLAPPLSRAVAEMGYTSMTPIQAKAIPPILDGKDLLGAAQTGTGKTAAFTLPLLQRLAANRPAGGDKIRRIWIHHCAATNDQVN